MMKIEKNLNEIKNKISEISAGRDVTIVAVTKFIDIPYMLEAIDLGIENIAENRPQEIKRKYEIIDRKINWHQIGTLQKNKVKYIIDKVELIHSLDSISLAEEIDKQAKKVGKIQKCLLQIKVSEEDSKKGIDEKEIYEIFDEINNNYNNINLCGVMGMAPYFQEPEMSRKYFKKLKEIFISLKQRSDKAFDILSMGMSNDYIVAVEEGATMVRIGTSLFG